MVGYISNAAVGSASAGDATGQKQIYFDGRVSILFEELMSKPVPQKEVSLEVLQAAYEKSLSKKKKTVKLGFKSAEAGSAIAYDIGESEAVNPLVLAVLKKLYTTEAETNKKLLELAKTSQSSEDFIRAVSKDFQIEYNFADQTARELFAEQNKNVLQEVLADYAEDFVSLPFINTDDIQKLFCKVLFYDLLDKIYKMDDRELAFFKEKTKKTVQRSVFFKKGTRVFTLDKIALLLKELHFELNNELLNPKLSDISYVSSIETIIIKKIFEEYKNGSLNSHEILTLLYNTLGAGKYISIILENFPQIIISDEEKCDLFYKLYLENRIL